MPDLDLRLDLVPEGLHHFNEVYVHPRDAAVVGLGSDGEGFIRLGQYTFLAKVDEAVLVPEGCIALSPGQAELIDMKAPTTVPVEGLQTTPPLLAAMEISFAPQDELGEPLLLGEHKEKLIVALKSRFSGQCFTRGQRFSMKFFGALFVVSCLSTEVASGGTSPDQSGGGMLVDSTRVICGQATRGPQDAAHPLRLFEQDFNFQELGIGGLKKEFEVICRRAFASRLAGMMNPALEEQLGVRHVKGLLLHGPPGSGKTLLARQIGKLLRCRSVQVVNGPEILNKYVGQSEENIRQLFKEAEDDTRKGLRHLHLIIFDEFDAIGKQRGSTQDGTGVHDSVINQLLSKMDGVSSLNNVLVIGMTNRRDLLDEALLRPGRFEVQIELGLPDADGRKEILSIHTSRLEGLLHPAVDISALASQTANYTGAELEGVVNSALSMAICRYLKERATSGQRAASAPQLAARLQLTADDFAQAVSEVRPAFGLDERGLQNLLRHGIVGYGPTWDHLSHSACSLAAEVRHSLQPCATSILLHGPAGTGKTALAAHLALTSGFPFVRVVSSEYLLGYSDLAKCSYLQQVFNDAHRSPLAVVVLDDLERLIEYSELGPVYSNPVLQALLVLVRRQPDLGAVPGSRVVVIGTTSDPSLIQRLGLSAAFSVRLHTPALNRADAQRVLETVTPELGDAEEDDKAAVADVLPESIGIKPLHTAVALARSTSASSPVRHGHPHSLASALCSSLRKFLG